ncbi:hypothetical protein EVAR_18680_1 [Eumeta japonica]|uniref:Uncharacterized protein n=1 Tax=Eumeta variegata TaxID=151549 RepID=A0A4C1U6U4_EUMVA|nr:hypothetical protein EVAR_18680_1 [Eumeta japonica]
MSFVYSLRHALRVRALQVRVPTAPEVRGAHAPCARPLPAGHRPQWCFMPPYTPTLCPCPPEIVPPEVPILPSCRPRTRVPCPQPPKLFPPCVPAPPVIPVRCPQQPCTTYVVSHEITNSKRFWLRRSSSEQKFLRSPPTPLPEYPLSRKCCPDPSFDPMTRRAPLIVHDGILKQRPPCIARAQQPTSVQHVEVPLR